MSNKLKYWYEKLPELNRNVEPLTHLMIRTTGETNNYIKNHNSKKIIVVNSKNINLLHSIDRKPALDKLNKRADFLKKYKNDIKDLEKKDGSIDLTSKFFLDSPFKSINRELLAQINRNAFVTISGVGRIAAIQKIFPQGIKLKMLVGEIDECLKKRLVAINNLYIYGNRFDNLKQYDITVEEIKMRKRVDTKKCYRRGKYLKRQNKKFTRRLVPML